MPKLLAFSFRADRRNAVSPGARSTCSGWDFTMGGGRWGGRDVGMHTNTHARFMVISLTEDHASLSPNGTLAPSPITELIVALLCENRTGQLWASSYHVTAVCSPRSYLDPSSFSPPHPPHPPPPSCRPAPIQQQRPFLSRPRAQTLHFRWKQALNRFSRF